MEWQGKSIVSSMHKLPVAGPLVVNKLTIDGDSFQQPKYHGKPHSVLYMLGVPSAEIFLNELFKKNDKYVAGTVGENLTLSDFDETQISVGDVFRIGEVIAQATFPRIPCGKVNYRMQHPEGQKAMQRCGRSGVYFQILEPGKIYSTDVVERVSQSPHDFKISEAYKLIVSNAKWSDAQIQRAETNGCFPHDFVEKLKTN